jgi:hypothetical protein
MITAIGSSRISDAQMGTGNTAVKQREDSKTSLIRAIKSPR